MWVVRFRAGYRAARSSAVAPSHAGAASAFPRSPRPHIPGVIFWGKPSAAVENSARIGDWLFPAVEISWFHLPGRKRCVGNAGSLAFP